MKIAAFLSHPIQHFSPLWKELARESDVQLKVYYFSRHGTQQTHDPDFGMKIQWDVDLLEGYESEFLPRQWPTKDPYDSRWHALNQGMERTLAGSSDLAYVAGYAHLNNWRIADLCKRRGPRLIYQSDSNFLAEQRKSPWLRIAKRIIVRRFFSRVSVFLATGDHNKAYLQHYGAAPERIHFCAIPVDVERFRRAALNADAAAKAELRRKLGLERADCVVGFSGKLIPRKRPQDLINALKRVNGSRVVGLFIGAGPMQSELEGQAGETARFPGFVNQQLMPAYLSLCDLVVMPSEYDPHPIVVTEAQSLGIPVILSDQCGCYGPHDVFRDGESGLLYPCGDIARLAQAIEQLTKDRELRSRMGTRARVLADEHSARAATVKFLAAARFAMALPAIRPRA